MIYRSKIEVVKEVETKEAACVWENTALLTYERGMVDKAGKVITAYTSQYFDPAMQEVVEKLFGK